jgi:hypothetical protein
MWLPGRAGEQLHSAGGEGSGVLLCMVVNVETVSNVNDLLLIVHELAHFIERSRTTNRSRTHAIDGSFRVGTIVIVLTAFHTLLASGRM